MRKTGVADLPLHYGKSPPWLFSRMKELAREITINIVDEFGAAEMLRKLSDPFWFQAFGCSLGFDWHSSGLTTTVCAALKEGVKGLEKELGIFVAGGKGRTSRRTPLEIEEFGELISADSHRLIYASRMAAKIDSAGLQDGFQLYHHSFIFTRTGSWVVIQQGMNEITRFARRYHWQGAKIKSFVCEPHAAICCDERRKGLNMVARESEEARATSAFLSQEPPGYLIKELTKIQRLKLSPMHRPLATDIRPKALEKILNKTYERKPNNFEELLALRGVGPKTIRALALVSDLVYGTRLSFRDPATYSFAHGGKDGYPYPVDREGYDKTIWVLKQAIAEAKIGRSEKLKALKRLANLVSIS
jgi:hypothetical protein